MQQHLADASVQHNGCALLMVLVKHHHGNAQLMAPGGGVAAVLAAMDAHPLDQQVQMRGCGALAVFIRYHPQNAQVIVAGNGREVVQEALLAHAADVNVARDGCDVLQGLANNHPPSAQAILNNQGVTVVLIAMQGQHLTDAGVQARGCQLLSNIVRQHHPAAQTIAINDPVWLQVVLAAMQQHPGVPGAQAEVQEYGCIALRQFARHYPQCRQTIANAGGGELVLAAMQTHPANGMVQQMGQSLLNVLPPAVLEAMQGHLTDAGVQARGCQLLLNIVRQHHPAAQTIAINDPVWLQVVLAAMRQYPGVTDAHVQVQKYACSVLWLFALHYPQCRQTIANAGGGELVLAAMQTHPANGMGATNPADMSPAQVVQQMGQLLLDVLPVPVREPADNAVLWWVMVSIAVLYMLFSAATQSPLAQQHDESEL
jgi:hypothetical protein